MGASPKVQPMLALPNESLGYTVLTGPNAGVWLSLSSKEKTTVQLSFVFPKCYTMSFNTKVQSCARDYQHNYIAHKHCHLTPFT